MWPVLVPVRVPAPLPPGGHAGTGSWRRAHVPEPDLHQRNSAPTTTPQDFQRLNCGSIPRTTVWIRFTPSAAILIILRTQSLLCINLLCYNSAILQCFKFFNGLIKGCLNMLCVPPRVYQASSNKNTCDFNKTFNAFPVIHKIYMTRFSLNTYKSIYNTIYYNI